MWLSSSAEVVIIKRKLDIANVILLLLLVSTSNTPQAKSSQILSTKVWSHTYGGKAGDYAYSLVQTEDGGYALIGFTQSFGAGNGDFWLIKTDENGVAPEFPSFFMLPLLAAIILFVIILTKKYPRKIQTNLEPP